VNTTIYGCFHQIELQADMFRQECEHLQAILLVTQNLQLHINLCVVRLGSQCSYTYININSG